MQSAQCTHSIWKGDLRMSISMGQTRTHFLHSIQVVGLVTIMHQQRIPIAQHALQIAVGANGSAEAQAEQAEVEKGDQRDGRAANARRGSDIEGHYASQDVERRHEVGDKNKARKTETAATMA